MNCFVAPLGIQYSLCFVYKGLLVSDRMFGSPLAHLITARTKHRKFLSFRFVSVVGDPLTLSFDVLRIICSRT